jgi:geranylgeranyl pyrophosphate synthase
MTIKMKNDPNFKNHLEERQKRINQFLVTLLPNVQVTPSHLHEAMHYSVLNGGKRIRPLLVYLTGESLGISLSILDYPAGAVELIHAYSLVHDDLPAMDNDDLRRGKPTCHKAFDEATAILVGDALQSLAFKVLAESNSPLSPSAQIEMINCLALASGSHGMAGGQALDLKAIGQKLTYNQLKRIHQLKTGALIAACVKMAMLAGEVKDYTLTDSLVSFAKYIGLCFQIKDDILDLEGQTIILGKQAGTDSSKYKATYTTIQGLERAKSYLKTYHAKATQALSHLGKDADYLKLLADYIVTRNH